MTARTERRDRRRQFLKQQAAAILAAITGSTQVQLRERAQALARHGNDDATIARELGVSTEIVREWLGGPHVWQSVLSAPPSSQPPEQQARADAIQYLQRAASAVVAWSMQQPRAIEPLGRAHAQLQDLLTELERVP